MGRDTMPDAKPRSRLPGRRSPGRRSPGRRLTLEGPPRSAGQAGGRIHGTRRRSRVRSAWAACLALTLVGCAPRRILTVESYPPGAVVRLDEKVIGRTPMDYRFEHYGKRRVTLYLPGYRTWSRRLELTPPWHARFPIDIVTELLIPIGLRDQHEVWVVLENDEVVGGHPDLGPLLERAKEMRARGAEIRAREEQAEGTAEPAPEDRQGGAGARP